MSSISNIMLNVSSRAATRAMCPTESQALVLWYSSASFKSALSISKASMNAPSYFSLLLMSDLSSENLFIFVSASHAGGIAKRYDLVGYLAVYNRPHSHNAGMANLHPLLHKSPHPQVAALSHAHRAAQIDHGGNDAVLFHHHMVAHDRHRVYSHVSAYTGRRLNGAVGR